jgi:hypothetical protein
VPFSILRLVGPYAACPGYWPVWRALFGHFALGPVPSLSHQRHNEILIQIRSAHAATRALLNVSDLAQGRLNILGLWVLDTGGLLGRWAILTFPREINPNADLDASRA